MDFLWKIKAIKAYMSTTQRPLAALLASLGLLSASQCYGNLNLVQNGNFATGDFTGWNASGGNEVAGASNDYGYQPRSGDAYFVAFGAVNGDSLLYQTISTVAGYTYDFSFWIIGNGAGPSDASVYWNGFVISVIGSPVPDQPWTQCSFTVTATASSTDIGFGLRNDPSWDGLGDVSVTEISPVPDTSTIIVGASMLLPFGAGPWRMLRKKLRLA